MTNLKAKFRSTRLFALAALTAASLGACSLFQSESTFDPVDLTTYEQTAQGHVVWSQSIGSSGDYGFTPVVVGDDVFAATPNGQVSRLALSNGAIRWSARVDGELSAGVGTDGQVVVVTTRDGRVVTLDAATGNQLWETRSSTRSSTPPVISGEMVVVRNDDFRVQGLDKRTGELQWSYMRTSAPLALKTDTAMVPGNGFVIVPLPVGRLVAIQTDNGRPLWDIKMSDAMGATDLDSVIDVVGQPIQVDDAMCATSYQGAVLCYRGGTAQAAPQLKWTRRFSSSVGLGASPNRVYASGMHGELTAFNSDNGEIIWQDDVLRNRGLSNPVYFNNKIYVGDYQGYMHFFDPNIGQIQGRMSVGDSRAIKSPLIVTPYGVLVQTGGGKLVMLGAQ
jgi:outer membrane protein assembly factor BamB